MTDYVVFWWPFLYFLFPCHSLYSVCGTYASFIKNVLVFCLNKMEAMPLTCLCYTILVHVSILLRTPLIHQADTPVISSHANKPPFASHVWYHAKYFFLLLLSCRLYTYTANSPSRHSWYFSSLKHTSICISCMISFHAKYAETAEVLLSKKAAIHQLTTMLATSKKVLFPGHNYLLTTGTDDTTHW